MKRIITICLFILILVGCADKTNANLITYYENKGITFSLPDNYYLADDGIQIIKFENDSLIVVGDIDYREFDNIDSFDKFKNTFTVDFEKDYINEIDAYKDENIIGTTSFEKYDFYNKERLNNFSINFIDQNKELINMIIKTINNKADIKVNTEETIDYSFSKEWNYYEYDSFIISLPNNVYISNTIENQTFLFIKNNNNFKKIGVLYLDEFSEKAFDYYKDVSPSDSRIQLTDNVYKGDNDIRSIYSIINYDKKTITSLEFYIDIDNDFEKQLIDSITINK